MTATYTFTGTSTFTEARAREVMHHVLGDFMQLASAGLLARETAQKWHDDLLYAVLHQAAEKFQLQLTRPDGRRAGIEYTVREDGTVLGSARAGGIDFYQFPTDTGVSIQLSYREGAPKLQQVQEYLRARHWTAGGRMIAGEATHDREYSKDGYGIRRSRVGDWG